VTDCRYRWLGHAAVRIDAPGGRIYVDPFQLRPKACPPGDLILVTNPRAGFFSPEDIAVVRGPGTRVFGPSEVVAETPGAELLRPGDEVEFSFARVRAVRAASGAGSFFPRDRNWLGYLIEADGTRYWHAGAGDRIPEMAGIVADVAFLPVSGRYVMDAAAAETAARAAGATVRVPLFLPGDRFRVPPGFTGRPAGPPA
jgi:L-ascorbate metabolism protein UlaG (beta-lactamase superfamily)